MHVNYNPNLVKLINEVRNLKILGYKIPEEIENTAQQAKQFMSQAKSLEQVRLVIIIIIVPGCTYKYTHLLSNTLEFLCSKPMRF